MNRIAPSRGKVYLLLAICLWVCAACVPLGRRVSGGHKPSPEAIAFLDRPGADKVETLATLGRPNGRSSDDRAFVYAWSEAPAWVGVSDLLSYEPVTSADVDGVFEQTENQFVATLGVVEGGESFWGLFIEFDDAGRVVTNETMRAVGPLDRACAAWLANKGRNP